MGKIVRAGAGAEAGIFDKLEPEPELELWQSGRIIEYITWQMIKSKYKLHLKWI
jgi:hypothetical protein